MGLRDVVGVSGSNQLHESSVAFDKAMILASVKLPFPAKILWPNGRGHYMAKAREFKKHKGWANVAALASWVKGLQVVSSIRLIVHPKTRNAIDRDNCIAASKAYFDGLAATIGIDDSTFPVPSVVFGEPVKGGLFVIEVEGE